MDNVYKISDFLSEEDLATIEFIMSDEESWSLRTEKKEDPDLGRIMYALYLPNDLKARIKQKVEQVIGRALPGDNGMFVDYSSKYGQPNLPPHFDGDYNAVIVDYQYKSNTTWGLGVGTEVFELRDNEALIFNPNEYPHWRPHKTFQDGEFVTMAFFRFPEDGVDYSSKRYSQDHEIFDEARKVRDSLKSEGME